MIRLTRVEPVSGNLLQVRVEGRITEQTAAQVRETTAAMLAEGRPLEIDLGGVQFVDATGARALGEAVAGGADLRNGSDFVMALIDTHRPEPGSTGPTPCAGLSAAESSLLERLRAGDDAAYDQVVREHGGRMLSTARRLLRGEEDARDAVQDAFLSAFRAIDGFAGGSKLSTWLHRIVVNACLMKLRSKSRRPEDSIEDLLPRYDDSGHRLEESRDWAMPGDAALERSQTRALVRRCIDALPETYRTVLLLRDIEDLDNDEIAAILGVNANTIKIRVHRARQALRGLILREANERPR